MRDVAGWRHAWWLVLVPLVVNALTGPWLAASGANGDERIVGVLLTAFCVMGSLVTWTHARRPDRALWWSLWSVPAAFAGTAVVMIGEGASGLAGYYAGIAVASAVGVALTPSSSEAPASR